MQHHAISAPTEVLDAFIGIDLGDRFSAICILHPDGTVVPRFRCHITSDSFEGHFGRVPRARLAQQLRGYGHEVIVANPRQLHLVTRNKGNSDPGDCRQGQTSVPRLPLKILGLDRHDDVMPQPLRLSLPTAFRARTAP